MGRPVAQAPEPKVVGDMIFGNCIVRHSVHREALVIPRVWHHHDASPTDYREASMTWHTFTLSRAERAARENELHMAFDLCFAAAAGPDDMALLTADGPAGERHYYASPGMLPWAANLLAQYGAEPCAPPAPTGLRLVVGHQGDIEQRLGLR